MTAQTPSAIIAAAIIDYLSGASTTTPNAPAWDIDVITRDVTRRLSAPESPSAHVLPRAAPKEGWHAFFASRTLPIPARTALDALVARALALTESGESWTESLGMRTQITEYTGGIVPEELPDRPEILADVLGHFGGESLDEIYPWPPHEILGIRGAWDIPGMDPKALLSEADLADAAEGLFTLAARADEGWGDYNGYGEGDDVEETPEDHRKGRAGVALEKDIRHRAGLGEVEVPRVWPVHVGKAGEVEGQIQIIPKDVAFDYIRRHHSQLPEPNPRGLLVAIGLYISRSLQGVSIGNTPSGRYTDPQQVVEVSRIATPGTRAGVSSSLMRWFMENGDQVARAHPALITTSSLLTEVGKTYQSLIPEGLRAVGLISARDPSGARAGSSEGKKEEWKIRWEFGPGAGAHVPHLLDLHRGYTAVGEGRGLTGRHFRGLGTLEAVRDLGRVLGYTKIPAGVSAEQAKVLLLARYRAD